MIALYYIFVNKYFQNLLGELFEFKLFGQSQNNLQGLQCNRRPTAILADQRQRIPKNFEGGKDRLDLRCLPDFEVQLPNKLKLNDYPQSSNKPKFSTGNFILLNLTQANSKLPIKQW